MERLAIKSLACCLALGLWIVLGPVGPATAQSVAGNEAWQVLERYGPVRYQPPGESRWLSAVVGAELPLGSRIVTGGDGWVIVRQADGNFWVEPNARFVLPTPDTPRVRQEVGNLHYRIVRMGPRQFEVETPYASLVVKGTVFDVRVAEAGMAVDVARGWVGLETGAGSKADLRAGQAARVSGGAAPTLEVRSAPDQAFEPVAPNRKRVPAMAPAVRASEIAPGDRDAGAAGEGQADGGGSWFERLRDMVLNSPPPTTREGWWGPGDGGSGSSSSGSGGGSSSSGSGGGSSSSGSGGGSGSSGAGGGSGSSGSGGSSSSSGSGGGSGSSGSGGSGSGGDGDGDGDGD